MTSRVDPHEIAALLFQAADATRRRFEEMCARYVLTPVQARLLLELEHPASMRQLSERLKCDQSNITGLADRLEEGGWVQRVQGPHDRRVRLLSTTRIGEALRRKLEAALYETSPFLANLTVAEQRTLRNLLRKMVAGQPRTEVFSRTAQSR